MRTATAERILAPRGERVLVRARIAAGELELRGELPCWQQPVALAPAGGWVEAALRVGPGVYEYKLAAAGGVWLLDPDNPRTRGRAGARNNVLVVGGSDEPVLHAPAAPWLERAGDGALRVRAALRRGAGDALAIRFDDGDGLHRVSMRPVGAEDEHLLFEARLPGAGRRVEYTFVLADGRVVGAGGRALIARDVRAPDLPAWWRDAVVYTVLVDRFRRGGGWRGDERWQRDHRAGGDLDGVAAALPYLADLGVTALHLTPVGIAPSAHRYDVVDPFRVDPAVGGDAAWGRLVEAAAGRGLRLIADVTTTHVHRDAAPFRDAAARGPDSPYWPWFRPHRWPFADGPDPGYDHYQKGQWQEPLLATDDAAVQDHLVAVVEHWLGRGAAGVRLDAAADLPLALTARLTAAARAVRADAVVMAEIVPDCVERWTATGAVDAATDFAGQRGLAAWLTGAPAPAVTAELGQLAFRRGGDGARLLGFTGTHDQPRLRTVIGDPRAARLGQLAILLRAPVPLLYYGDEVGLAASGDAAVRDFEDSWPDRQCMPWDEASWETETLALVRAAIALRRRTPALARGDEELGAAADDVLWIRRRLGREVVDVFLHRGDGAARVALPAADPDAAAVPLLALGDARVTDGEIGLGPWSAIAVDRTPRLDVALAAGNAALAAAAFAAGRVASPAYPTRLNLTVTEACNLRCAHCITDAPRRTRDGRARTIQPWLLDALDDAFAHADHVAFTHGGESLAAPIFPEVLRRLQRARGRRSGRADVHLASNGMLLDADRLRALVDLGVTSLMISVDGASAAVNDRIRVGGSLERVLAAVRAAVRLRAAGADLRIGLSTVVGRACVGEVPALADLAADLGVDWLKLEETWPATPFARLDRLPPGDPALLDAVALVSARLAAAGVVLVDHLDPPTACPCTSDDARAHAFRRADDHANRFRYRPCRVLWEQAAIDPDGILRAGDYSSPPLGSVLHADVLSLWNAPAALEQRRVALTSTTPAQRARCAAS